MFEPLGTPRPLPYPLKDQETNGNITDDLGLVPNDFVWPEDPEERVIVPFLFSQREFTAVLSAVDVGADIAYPLQYIEVYWLLVRSLRYRVPICSLIIDCIQNDIDTQQAIVDMIMNNQTFNNYLDQKIDTLTQELITTKIIQPGSCDRPELAGRVKALVDAMDKANNDWFEKIETGTNSEEKFALVVGAIPGLETLPIDDAVDFAQDILEDFTEEYSAQVDGALLQEWYCGLLCVAEKNADCSLSWGEIYDYFANRVQSGLNPFSTLADIVNFIVTGEYYGSTPIADATMALQTGLMVTQRSFFGSSLPSISYVTRDAPTSTFYEDCEECPEDDLWLSPVIGSSDSIELISDDGETQTWVLHNYTTGNYLTGGAVSSNGTAFYILDVEYNPVATGADARFILDYANPELDKTVCYKPTAKMWIYNSKPGGDVTVTISRQPCPVWELFSWGWGGNITSQSATQVTVQSTFIGSGVYRAGATTIEGLVFHVSDRVATPGFTYAGYYDAENVNTPGMPPVGANIRGFYVENNAPFEIVVTGSING